MQIKLALQLVQNMGLRYTAYRIRHELDKKTGRLIKKHPMGGVGRHFEALSQWRSTTPVFHSKASLELPKALTPQLEAKAKRILKGDVLFFSHEWRELGLDYNWITNPDSGFSYDINKHWSQIPDLSEAAGDIKFVWEKSRFSFLLPLICYDYHSEQDCAEFVMSQLESWIDANPVNQGPNWRCSQEISLRIFNWKIALDYYKDSPALTEARWQKIQNVIYWSLHHVYHHIDFSRIAVRNNHAITETLLLSLSSTLFPFIPDTVVWSKKGRDWFEQEIAYQIYEDGTFLQFSMNYHRVVIQLLTLGISVTEKNQQPFSKTVYDRAYKSLDFLYQCLQEESGWLPNYGSNDGALFFPFSHSDYRDYRPQLNALHLLLTGAPLYQQTAINSETHWWKFPIAGHAVLPPLDKKTGVMSYPVGGFYLMRDGDAFTFIRCGNHKDRPAQADNLHIDLWVGGKNVLRDSGTYKYNTTTELIDYFTGTASHNSVTVANQSQMLKGNRFIWYFWTQCQHAKLIESADSFVFEGAVKAFRYLEANATHQRVVRKIKGENKWFIEDTFSGLDGLAKQQIWHHDHHRLHISATETGNRIASVPALSYNSDYYGQIIEGKASRYEFKNTITTIIAYDPA